MARRDTTTGRVLEEMVLPALEHGGYVHQEQVMVGERLGTGHQHKVDIVAVSASGERFLVSLKWQQSSGTAEQKVPFEVISLEHAVKCSDGFYKRAYLVLGGSGWTLREYFTSGRLSDFIAYDNCVSIVTLEQFIASANAGKL
jgi:hypothetical protein